MIFLWIHASFSQFLFKNVKITLKYKLFTFVRGKCQITQPTPQENTWARTEWGSYTLAWYSFYVCATNALSYATELLWRLATTQPYTTTDTFAPPSSTRYPLPFVTHGRRPGSLPPSVWASIGSKLRFKPELALLFGSSVLGLQKKNTLIRTQPAVGYNSQV